MPKFVIEREISGIGQLTPAEYTGASQKSCSVLRVLGPEIQWVESYVTADKMYCVYIAEDVDLIRKHAVQSGFPAHRISEITRMVDPTTSEG